MTFIKPIRCKDKQCGAAIAVINGPNHYVDCPKCGKRRKVHDPPKGIRLKLAAQ
jgi:hypothetical protein